MELPLEPLVPAEVIDVGWMVKERRSNPPGADWGPIIKTLVGAMGFQRP